MSKYNHVEFLKKDPVGEVNFIIGNIRRKVYECCSTVIGELMLKMGGGKIRQARKVQRAGTGGEVSVQYH